jgi:hypothetical protein
MIGIGGANGGGGTAWYAPLVPDNVYLKQLNLLLIFALACAVPLMFAIYTQHA